MTADDYVLLLFEGATGWLGWPPDVALDTPMGWVAVALRGRLRMMRAQAALLGGGGILPDGPAPAAAAPDGVPLLPDGTPDRAAIARKVRAVMRRISAGSREAAAKGMGRS